MVLVLDNLNASKGVIVLDRFRKRVSFLLLLLVDALVVLGHVLSTTHLQLLMLLLLMLRLCLLRLLLQLEDLCLLPMQSLQARSLLTFTIQLDYIDA